MILTREQLEDIEKKTLAPYATLNKNSKGRPTPEDPDLYRLPFQRDRDRIIHSKAFRRLKDKTQVFISGSGDHFRNRLTHTMEVAQISRDIARTLGLNEDLAETIALAHDIGHTPFGHAGETALNEILKDFGLGFEHNEQSKRTVEILEHPYPNSPGLNLTKETIDGLIKHQSPYDNATKTFNFLPSLEAQVVNLADEIAYTSHDIDDGLRSNIITREQLEKLELWQNSSKLSCIKYKVKNAHNLSRDRIISQLIGILINDLYQFTEQSIQKNRIDSIETVHNFEGNIVQFSKEMHKKIKPLREFLYNDLYLSEQVSYAMAKGQKMIKELFHYYLENTNKLPEHFQKEIPKNPSKHNKLIVVKDYIAGMTDVYAKEEWKNLVT